jgi:hypothetical protein
VFSFGSLQTPKSLGRSWRYVEEEGAVESCGTEGICTVSFLIVHLIYPVLVRILALELGIDRMPGHLDGYFLVTLLRRIASR